MNLKEQAEEAIKRIKNEQGILCGPEYKEGYIAGHQSATEAVREEAVRFAEWIVFNEWSYLLHKRMWAHISRCPLATTADLFTQFKQQK